MARKRSPLVVNGEIVELDAPGFQLAFVDDPAGMQPGLLVEQLPQRRLLRAQRADVDVRPRGRGEQVRGVWPGQPARDQPGHQVVDGQGLPSQM